MSFTRSVVQLARSAPIPTARLVLPSAAIGAARASSTLHCRRPTTLPLRASPVSAFQQQQKRWSSGGGLGGDEIERRVLEVLQSFEKAEPGKITPTASFAGDLGLDSLDAVEVVLAIEEEFSIEIPDEEADKITTVAEAISYIARTPEAV